MICLSFSDLIIFCVDVFCKALLFCITLFLLARIECS